MGSFHGFLASSFAVIILFIVIAVRHRDQVPKDKYGNDE
jgi:hypothetical protein